VVQASSLLCRGRLEACTTMVGQREKCRAGSKSKTTSLRSYLDFFFGFVGVSSAGGGSLAAATPVTRRSFIQVVFP